MLRIHSCLELSPLLHEVIVKRFESLHYAPELLFLGKDGAPEMMSSVYLTEP